MASKRRLRSTPALILERRKSVPFVAVLSHCWMECGKTRGLRQGGSEWRDVARKGENRNRKDGGLRITEDRLLTTDYQQTTEVDRIWGGVCNLAVWS